MADERYTQLEPYPWDAGVPRDWPQQGYIGPSTYKLPAWRLGADAASGGSGILPLLLIGGAVFLFLKFGKGGGGRSAPAAWSGVRRGEEYEIDSKTKSSALYRSKSSGDFVSVSGPESKISRLPDRTSNLPGWLIKLDL